jgi:hypothetical protein
MVRAEGAERALDRRRIEPTGDEYQTRRPILIWPRVQMAGRMHEVLHGVDRHRRGRVGDVEDTLDPQQRIAMAVQQHCQPNAEPRPIDRLVEAERSCTDIIGVAMMIIRHMAMATGRPRALDAIAIGRKQRVGIEILFGITPERRVRIDLT